MIFSGCLVFLLGIVIIYNLHTILGCGLVIKETKKYIVTKEMLRYELYKKSREGRELVFTTYRKKKINAYLVARKV